MGGVPPTSCSMPLLRGVPLTSCSMPLWVGNPLTFCMVSLLVVKGGICPLSVLCPYGWGIPSSYLWCPCWRGRASPHFLYNIYVGGWGTGKGFPHFLFCIIHVKEVGRFLPTSCCVTATGNKERSPKWGHQQQKNLPLQLSCSIQKKKKSFGDNWAFNWRQLSVLNPSVWSAYIKFCTAGH